MRLEEWALTYGDRISGKVYGSHRFDDGHRVTTSSVMSVIPKTKSVKTSSGSLYRLGEPLSGEMTFEALSRHFSEGK